MSVFKHMDTDFRDLAYNKFKYGFGTNKDKYAEVSAEIEEKLVLVGISPYVYGSYVADLIATEWEKANDILQPIPE